MGKRARAYIYLLGATAIWGSASPIIKFTLQGIDPLPFLAYRFMISGVLGLIIILVLKPKLPKKLRDWALLCFYGLLATTIALGFLFLGLDRTTVLKLGIIGAISPLVVVLGGGLLLRERITAREKKGIFLALVGVIITILAPVLLGQDGFKLSGNMLLVLYLVSDAGSILLAKKMTRQKFEPILMTNIAFVVGAATLVPFALYKLGIGAFVESITTLSAPHHLGVWYMAIASGTLAYYFFIRGERSIEAGEAGLFFYLQPIFTIPLAVLWLKETVSLPYIFGALIIAAGVYIAETRKS